MSLRSWSKFRRYSHSSETNFDVHLWVGSHMFCSRCFWRHCFQEERAMIANFFSVESCPETLPHSKKINPIATHVKPHYCSAHLARTFTYEEPTTQSMYSTISRAEPLSAQYSNFDWEQNQIYRYLPSVSADGLNLKPAVAEVERSSKVTYTGSCTCYNSFISSPWICSSFAMRQKIRSASPRERDRHWNHWPDSCASLAWAKYRNRSCWGGLPKYRVEPPVSCFVTAGQRCLFVRTL